VTDDFAALPDLASRALGASVVHATDDLFAERENLIGWIRIVCSGQRPHA